MKGMYNIMQNINQKISLFVADKHTRDDEQTTN
jgi:hypothetical protein